MCVWNNGIAGVQWSVKEIVCSISSCEKDENVFTRCCNFDVFFVKGCLWERCLVFLVLDDFVDDLVGVVGVFNLHNSKCISSTRTIAVFDKDSLVLDFGSTRFVCEKRFKSMITCERVNKLDDKMQLTNLINSGFSVLPTIACEAGWRVQKLKDQKMF